MNTPRNRTSSARRTRRISTWIAASAVALGMILLAAGQVSAGDRSHFSIGFSLGGHHHGHHYKHRYGHHGYGHHRYYHRGRHYKHYGHHRYYRHRPYYYRHKYRSYYPYRHGVSLHYNHTTYRPNTARLIYPPRSSRTYSTTTTYTAPSTPRNNIAYQYNYEADGWSLLRNNRSRQALNTFAEQAKANPNAGLPKVGYALSQAVVGNDAKAAWAMRRALQYDAAALDQVPHDAATQGVLSELLNMYRQRAEDYPRADDPFMVAALAYLNRDYAEAKHAADALVKTHPDDPAIRTLSSMAEHQQSKAAAPSQGHYQYPYQP